MVDVRRAPSGAGSIADDMPARRQLDDHDVHVVAARLREEFHDTGDFDVDARVRDEFGRWSEARVTQFVPLLVERHVRRQLRDRLNTAIAH